MPHSLRRYLTLAILAFVVAACAVPSGNATIPAAEQHADEDAGTTHIADLAALDLAAPLQVIATTSIIGDVASQVAGDVATVSTLLPAGSDPHGYVPTPQDMVALSDANLVLVNGVGLEEALLPLLDSIEGPVVVSVNEGVEVYQDETHDHEAGHETDHEDEHESVDLADIVDLAPWEGEWTSGSAYISDAVADEPIHALAEGFGVDNTTVRDLLDAFLATDFASAVITHDAITYTNDNGNLTCPYNFDAVVDGDFEGTPFQWVNFESTDSACAAYRYALFTLPHGEGADRHFHMRYGATSFDDLMSNSDLALWWPSLFPTSLTADEFIAGSLQPTGEIAAFVGSVLGIEAKTAEMQEDEHADEGQEEAHEGDEDHDHEHTGGDPHTWQDVANVRIWTQNIAATLSAVDPANADVYAANATAYDTQLAALQDEIATLIASIPAEDRKLVTDHDDLGYFARAHGFEVIGAVIPSPSALASVSAQQMAALQRQIEDEGMRAIFVGNTVNPDLANQLAQDTGVQVVPLYTDALGGPDSPAPTYIDMMRYNAQSIADALNS